MCADVVTGLVSSGKGGEIFSSCASQNVACSGATGDSGSIKYVFAPCSHVKRSLAKPRFHFTVTVVGL